MNAAIRSAFQPILSVHPRPTDSEALNSLVDTALNSVKDISTPENRRNYWEFLLRQEVLKLASTEHVALKEPETTYYDELQFLLDLVLTFTEHEACENSLPFNVLEDLLEAQTVASCPHIFSWIEARATRLRAGMVPNKGKALILLRMLNDLLRRLSKTGGTTTLCGRILTFLSGVFPLGERSGVNLRGEYGPAWEGVRRAEAVVGVVGKAGKERDPKDDEAREGRTEDQMDVEDVAAVDQKAQQKAELYETFWSLQTPFSRPATFVQAGAFASFKEAVEKVLPVIKEASAKERAMMGSKSGQGSLKRKRAADAMDTADGAARSDYFFAKFLTSPELLDLEIADVHFRRQVLFQLLIALDHVLTFTKDAKAAWVTPRNRSLQLDLTPSPEDAQWAVDVRTRALDELRQTAPAGRAAADSARTVLTREQNWVKWKNELCAPFDRPAWTLEKEDGELGGKKRKVGLWEATLEKRRAMRVEPESWPHELGSPALTDLWEMGFQGLHNLENFAGPGDLKDFVRRSTVEDRKITARRQHLDMQAKRLAAARAKVAANKAPPQTMPPAPKKDGEDVVMEPAVPALAPAIQEQKDTLSAPTTVPQAAPGGSPLHPSLPAKPGSSPAQTPAVAAPPASATLVPALAPVATSAPTPAEKPAEKPADKAEKVDKPPPLPPADDMIARFEDAKYRIWWLGLRAARDEHLVLFGKARDGDIAQLYTEVERAKKERERGEDVVGERSQSPVVGKGDGQGEEGFEGKVDIVAAELDTVMVSEKGTEALGKDDVRMET